MTTEQHESRSTRRHVLATGAAGLAGWAATQTAPKARGAAEAGAEAASSGKRYSIGVVSASIGGKPQKTNGHTWHFAQGFHPHCNLDAVKKYLDPGSVALFEKYLRHPRMNFDQLPFADATNGARKRRCGCATRATSGRCFT